MTTTVKFVDTLPKGVPSRATLHMSRMAGGSNDKCWNLNIDLGDHEGNHRGSIDIMLSPETFSALMATSVVSNTVTLHGAVSRPHKRERVLVYKASMVPMIPRMVWKAMERTSIDSREFAPVIIDYAIKQCEVHKIKKAYLSVVGGHHGIEKQFVIKEVLE